MLGGPLLARENKPACVELTIGLRQVYGTPEPATVYVTGS